MPILRETVEGLPEEAQALVEELIYRSMRALEDELTSSAEDVGITMFKSLTSEEKGYAVADLAFSVDPVKCSRLAESHPKLRDALDALEKGGVKLAELDTPDEDGYPSSS